MMLSWESKSRLLAMRARQVFACNTHSISNHRKPQVRKTRHTRRFLMNITIDSTPDLPPRLPNVSKTSPMSAVHLCRWRSSHMCIVLFPRAKPTTNKPFVCWLKRNLLGTNAGATSSLLVAFICCVLLMWYSQTGWTLMPVVGGVESWPFPVPAFHALLGVQRFSTVQLTNRRIGVHGLLL